MNIENSHIEQDNSSKDVILNKILSSSFLKKEQRLDIVDCENVSGKLIIREFDISAFIPPELNTLFDIYQKLSFEDKKHIDSLFDRRINSAESREVYVNAIINNSTLEKSEKVKILTFINDFNPTHFLQKYLLNEEISKDGADNLLMHVVDGYGKHSDVREDMLNITDVKSSGLWVNAGHAYFDYLFKELFIINSLDNRFLAQVKSVGGEDLDSSTGRISETQMHDARNVDATGVFVKFKDTIPWSLVSSSIIDMRHRRMFLITDIDEAPNPSVLKDSLTEMFAGIKMIPPNLINLYLNTPIVKQMLSALDLPQEIAMQGREVSIAYLEGKGRGV